MANDSMMAQMSGKGGFIAALDQSGGSTPKALAQYGVPESAYSGDAAMFGEIHKMRVRIVTAPAFTGERVIGAILFEGTMDGEADGQPVPSYLWEKRGVVPFVKVDKGLEAETDGVQLMRPMPQLDGLLARAAKLGVFGTKMRSVIARASKEGIAAIVRQQFEVAEQISRARSDADHRAGGVHQGDRQGRGRGNAEGGDPETPRRPARGPARHAETDHPDEGRCSTRTSRIHPKVVRVVALSGGYTRDEACEKLSHNHGMIASFSRALIDDLRHGTSEAEFDATLAKAIDQIYRASTVKA